MTGHDSIVLPASVHAPARARDWLAARAAAMPALLDDALLVVSELVTNAVRHGRPRIVLSVEPLPSGLRIVVGDEGERVPVPPTGRPGLGRAGGRGLLIVAATAHDWGVTPYPSGPGKIVWADLISS